MLAHDVPVHSFEIASDLTTAAEIVWQHAVSLEGVNRELMPLVRMTVPRGLAGATLEHVPLGRRLGKSWLLLFGLVPVDYDELIIVERDPGRRFFEQSAMMTQSRWWHERIVEPLPGGCRITDRLRWQGRARPFGALFRAAVPLLFRHRHRRLRLRFGVLLAPDAL